ncbi:MAG TPA: N-acetyltransferase family protein [Leptolyngbyaceae cyanobacterium]
MWTEAGMIRDAVETDLAEIVAIYNASIPSRLATADLEPVSFESRQAWFHQHSPSAHPIWVMEVDRAIAGWLSFQSFYGRPAYHATAEISIYVAPVYRRCGVARQLLSQAIHHSPALGLKTLLGFIFAHNQPSLQLFNSFGFQRWGYLPAVAELDGVERNLTIMGKRICQEK